MAIMTTDARTSERSQAPERRRGRDWTIGLRFVIALIATAVFVARIAIHAVVDIPADPLVIGVGTRLGMARSVRARKHHVVVRIRVASSADSVRVTVIDAPPRVTKRCAAP